MNDISSVSTQAALYAQVATPTQAVAPKLPGTTSLLEQVQQVQDFQVEVFHQAIGSQNLAEQILIDLLA